MLTPDMSTAQWWLLALASGAALGWAVMTLAARPSHRVVAVCVPLVMAAALWGDVRVREYDERQLLFDYTLVCLTLVILRLVYAPWFTRNLRLRREGRPMENAPTRHAVLFPFVFIATAVGVAFLIH